MTLPLPAHVVAVDALPAHVVAVDALPAHVVAVDALPPPPKATVETQIFCRFLVGNLIGVHFSAADGSLCEIMGYVTKSIGRQLLIDGTWVWVDGCKLSLSRSFLVDVSHVRQSAPCEAVSALMCMSKACVSPISIKHGLG
jgi:hypothetical protein